MIAARIKRFVSIKGLFWVIGFLAVITLILVLFYRFWLLPFVNKQIGVIYFEQTGRHLAYSPLKVSLRRCEVTLFDLKDEKQLFSLQQLNIDIDCRKSLQEHQLVIRHIQLNNLQLKLTQTNSGWNFDDILAVQQKQNTAKEKDPTIVVIEKTTVNDLQVNFQSDPLAQHLLVALPRVNISKLKSDLSIPLHLDTQGQLSQHAKPQVAAAFSATLNLDLKKLAGRLDTEIQHLPFNWLDKELKQYLLADIQSGEITASQKLQLNQGEIKTILSNGTLSNVVLRPMLMDQDAVKWRSLEWKSAQIDLEAQSAVVPEMVLTGLDGQFIIDKNRKTNLQALIKPDATSPQSPATKNPQASNGSVSNSANESAWQFTLGHLRLNNAAIGFFDQSLVPSFSVIVQQFSGDITQVSTDPTKETLIDLKGNVDGYSPVTLAAKAKLFTKIPELNAQFKLNNLDMGALSPYSAEYAGWKIRKGHLTVALDYRYEQGKVIGRNHVVISHLKFGEKVRSPNVLDLPLRLGLSLLTDENGEAVLDAEITGDPKNPKFNFKEIIWRAIKNSFHRVVTSPFRLLASLVNTEHDLGKITFVYGESQLTSESKQKLSLIKQALDKRPNLLVNVKPNIHIDLDTQALKEEQVKTLLKSAGATSEELSGKGGNWQKLVAQVGKQKNIAENILGDPSKTYQALISAEFVTEERLMRLRHERAQAIKQYFVIDLHTTSERVLIDGQDTCGKALACNEASAEFVLDSE